MDPVFLVDDVSPLEVESLLEDEALPEDDVLSEEVEPPSLVEDFSPDAPDDASAPALDAPVSRLSLR